MARLRKKHLPHRIDIEPFGGDGAEGDIWEAKRTDRPAYVEQRARLRVDRRSTSPTSGQEIVSSTFIVVLTGDDCAPRSRVTVWPGTPRERTAEVIDSVLYDYPGTPGHAELFLE